MIEQLNLTDFQSHKKTKLSFHPGLNIISGDSDSGKTALVRAIRWIVFNKPGGHAFIRHDQKECAVEMIVDGVQISRGRTKTKNFYHLDRGGVGDDQESRFTAFGSKVPEEISSLLNLSDINFQFQLDAPFLLSGSSGDAARYFNSIAKMDLIEVSIANINRWRRSCLSTIKHDEDKLEELETKLEAYATVDEEESILERIKDNGREYGEKLGKKLALERTLDSIALIKAEIDASEGIEDLGATVQYYISQHERLSIIKDAVGRISRIDRSSKDAAAISDLQDAVDEIIPLLNRHKILGRILNNISDTDMAIESLEKRQELYESEMVDRFGDRCPVCGAVREAYVQ